MKQENSRKSEIQPIVSNSTPRHWASSSKAAVTINGGGGRVSSTTNPPPPVPKTSSSSRTTRRRSQLVVNKPKSVVVSSSVVNKDNVVVGVASSPTPIPPIPKKGIIIRGGGGELHNSSKFAGRSGCRPIVEQFARPSSRRRSTTSDDPANCSTRRNQLLLDHHHPNPDSSRNELLEKLALSETSIKNLHSQVLVLKSELDNAHILNAELLSQNKKLTQDLLATAAAANLEALAVHPQLKRESIAEYQTPKFKDIQKLIANKLEHSKLIAKEATSEASTSKYSSTSPVHPSSIAADEQENLPVNPAGLPPPPPPPPRPPAKTATARKAPAFVEFYHSLTKREGNIQSPAPTIHNKPAAISAHSSIVGEIENRSAHLMAIKLDIETKGEFINGLIQKVLAADYTDIEEVLKFADWLDNELSSLADERAVLKHFKWPERKADAMREAAIEYRELKVLECEISSYKDDADLPFAAALKKIASLLDKSERSIQRLIKLRNSVMLNYQNYKIPTDWMLDSGIVRKIKQTSMKLAKMYMKRVTIELESVRNSEESAQEALMLQGVHFAYRTHQFAGGLDSDTLCALEEIRQRVPGQLGGSRELLTGIPSS